MTVSEDGIEAAASSNSVSSQESEDKLGNFRRTLRRWMRLKKARNQGQNSEENNSRTKTFVNWKYWKKRPRNSEEEEENNPCSNRALPPVPLLNSHLNEEEEEENSPNGSQDFPPGMAYLPEGEEEEEEEIHFGKEANGVIDFAASIETVKNYGWYWGPISGEAAERLLQNEPDGSFVVRDSSDVRYIFSLTFKLNGTVRHVRIEHDQGNFSFGSFTKFKSNTIEDFVETAVEHSRSGRYLFFLNRRPVNGPMRVQLLHPVSRFKQVQSLQHLCRFVILKMVPRDLLYQLPVPKRIRDYLDTPFYYSETVADWDDPTALSEENREEDERRKTPIEDGEEDDANNTTSAQVHLNQDSENSAAE